MILAFKKEFVSQVVDGTKVHSVRAGNRWREGQVIDFFTNVRQPSMARIRPNGFVKRVQTVRIWKSRRLFVDGRRLQGAELEGFARRDGFPNADLLFHFFGNHHELPFTGQLIHWTDLTY